MIFKRVVAKLRAQEWMAITIEVGIVIIGVFFGTQVSNWNADRIEKRNVDQLLVQMRPELTRMRFADTLSLRYYATTRRYAEVALDGWAGDTRVSDRDFVVAGYQASQITGQPRDAPLATSVLGADEVRKVRDPALRSALLRMINFSFDSVSASAMQTRYREHVRETIPDDIQQLIRRDCGDRVIDGGLLVLPSSCFAAIAPERIVASAAALRARPELARELHFHLSQAATFELNTNFLDQRIATLQQLLAARFGPESPNPKS
jgi:hypothetical protein